MNADNSFLPFSRPSISADDRGAVLKVLESGWITTGAKCAEFEEQFSRYTGSLNSVALSSGTAGMHLLLAAFGIGLGDEVITPSMTWVSTINLITLAGAVPIFADVDRDTLMVTADTIAPCMSPRVKMIIPVHFAGGAVDMNPIQKMAETAGVAVVEDAAHALGSGYKGRKIGATGTAVFSFHPIKNITTGEGGMVCTDDGELVEKIRRMKFHGLGVDAFDRLTRGRLPKARVIAPGYKYNLPDILAALGLSQLKRINEFNEKRKRLAMLYHELLNDVDEIIPLGPPGKETTHSWHLFVVRLDIEKAGMDRDLFMERMKENRIGTGIHFQAVHLHDYYQKNLPPDSLRKSTLKNTEWNSERILSLPLFPDMTKADVRHVVDIIKKVMKK